MPKTYDHRAVEGRWYEEWVRRGAIQADPEPPRRNPIASSCRLPTLRVRDIWATPLTVPSKTP